MRRSRRMLRPALVVFAATIALAVSPACESPSPAERSSDDRATATESTEESSDERGDETEPEKPTLPERPNPERHESACAEESFADLDKVIKYAAPYKLQYHHAKVLSLACGDSLPAPLRTWLKANKGNRMNPPPPSELEGVDDVFEAACPAGVSVLESTADLGWRERLDALYHRCGFSALDLASADEFRRATGPEAAVMAMVLYRWLRADGVKVSYAKRITRGLANFDGERFYGTAGEVLRHRPEFHAARSTVRLEPHGMLPVVVGPDGLWSEGERTVEFGDGLEPTEALKEAMKKVAESRERSSSPIQIAVSADTPYFVASKVTRAAAQAGSYKYKFLVSAAEDLSASGSSETPAEWESKFRVINLVAPRSRLAPRLKEQTTVRTKTGRLRKTARRPEQELTVAIKRNGFRISDSEEMLSPSSGCTRDDVSVCLADPDADDLLERYNWAGLYDRVAELHAEHPDETIFHVTAERDLPFRLVVRAMDVVRWERQTEEGTPLGSLEAPTNEQLEASEVVTCEKDVEIPCRMFSDPVLESAL